MTIFGLPGWLVFVALALLCVVGWLFESLVKAHQDLTPKFLASFDPERGGISETQLYRNGTEFVDDGKYLRVTVQNIALRSVENCVANLVRIERQSTPTTTEVLWDQDALPLAWAMIRDFEAKIHHEAKRFVEVGRILKGSGQFKFATVLPNRLVTKLRDGGTFIVTVVVTGDGVSQSVQIEVRTDGTFEGFTARAAVPKPRGVSP
jgi:hypothetical protein